MKKILICWIGHTDLRASNGELKSGDGPIAEALKLRPFDDAVLLNNAEPDQVEKYIEWLRPKCSTELKTEYVSLTSPTNFSEIYTAAVKCIESVYKNHGKKNTELTYHISPGTSHMAAVWVILAKTRFPAELIDSSIEEGEIFCRQINDLYTQGFRHYILKTYKEMLFLNYPAKDDFLQNYL